MTRVEALLGISILIQFLGLITYFGFNVFEWFSLKKLYANHENEMRLQREKFTTELIEIYLMQHKGLQNNSGNSECPSIIDLH